MTKSEKLLWAIALIGAAMLGFKASVTLYLLNNLVSPAL